MHVHTGLSAEEETKSAQMLNSLLADHFTLLLKTWQFHWNVVGDSFGSYHEAMLKLYEAEIERVDDVAERIRALGQRPLGNMNAMLTATTVMEFSMGEEVPSAIKMWEYIRNDWDHIIRRIRDIHSQIPEKDLATLNFLEDMIEVMEKEAWMIRSYTTTPSQV